MTALGHGVGAQYAGLIAGRSPLVPCAPTRENLPGYVGEVAAADTHRLEGEWAPFDCRNNRLADLALRADGFAAAVAEARENHGPARVAVVVGTSTSGIDSCESAFRARDAETGALPDWFDYAHTHDMGSLARFVAGRLGLRGPAFTVSAACASSARAFLDAAHLIASGVADAAVVGGADSLCAMTLHGFAALDLIAPERCRPCDADRAGISVGEAAGFALLERPEAARAEPVGLLLGAGASSDGHHMSAPDPRGAGAMAAMRGALAAAGRAPDEVDYVSLHGTGTRANDAMEDGAVFAVFGGKVACGSIKGFTGHTLGACGIVGAVIATLCLRHGFRPGCLGVETLDPTFRTRVLSRPEAGPVRHVLSNAFGFGGINCSLLFGRT